MKNNTMALFICVTFTFTQAFAVQLSPLNSKTTAKSNYKKIMLQKLRTQQAINDLDMKLNLQRMDQTVRAIIQENGLKPGSGANSTSAVTLAPTPANPPVTLQPPVVMNPPVIPQPPVAVNPPVAPVPAPAPTPVVINNPTPTSPTAQPPVVVNPPVAPTPAPQPTPAANLTPAPQPPPPQVVIVPNPPKTITTTVTPVPTPTPPTPAPPTTVVNVVRQAVTPIPSPNPPQPVTVTQNTGAIGANLKNINPSVTIISQIPTPIPTPQPQPTQTPTMIAGSNPIAIPPQTMTAVTDFNGGKIDANQLKNVLQNFVTQLNDPQYTKNLVDPAVVAAITNLQKQPQTDPSIAIMQITQLMKDIEDKSAKTPVTTTKSNVDAQKQAAAAALQAAQEKISKAAEEAQKNKKTNAITNAVNTAVSTVVGLIPTAGAARAGTEAQPVIKSGLMNSQLRDVQTVQADIVKAAQMIADPKATLQQKMALTAQLGLLQVELVQSAAMAGANMNQLANLSSNSQNTVKSSDTQIKIENLINQVKTSTNGTASAGAVADTTAKDQQKQIEQMMTLLESYIDQALTRLKDAGDRNNEMFDNIQQALQTNNGNLNRISSSASSSAPAPKLAVQSQDPEPQDPGAAFMNAGFNPGGSTLNSGPASQPIFQTAPTAITNNNTIKNNPVPTGPVEPGPLKLR